MSCTSLSKFKCKLNWSLTSIDVYWYLRFSGLAMILCILTGIDARRILTQGMQDSTCAGCICVGATIFHTDAVEFIKCTQPRGALLSLGLVHFMLILWMQWYMKRGTLCAKAPDIGRKCTKRPLTVTASYSTGVYSSFVGPWCSLSYQRMDCTIVPNDPKWYSSNRHEETT